VKSLQADIAKSKPVEFAPDDADLRESAEETAVALTDKDSGITISSLGKDGKKTRASERLVEAVFDTPGDKLDEMTELSSRLEAFACAGVRTMNQYVQGVFNVKPGDKPIFVSDMFLNNMFKLNRSVGGKHLLRALAMTQIQRESEEAQERAVVFGGGGSNTDY